MASSFDLQASLNEDLIHEFLQRTMREANRNVALCYLVRSQWQLDLALDLYWTEVLETDQPCVTTRRDSINSNIATAVDELSK